MTLNNRCRTIIGTPKGTIILTTTQLCRKFQTKLLYHLLGLGGPDALHLFGKLRCMVIVGFFYGLRA